MTHSRLLILICFFISTQVHAAEMAGLDVHGEAAFDYQHLSSTLGIPNTGSAPHETYRFNYAQVLIKKETDKLSFLGRLQFARKDYVTTTVPTEQTGTSYLTSLDEIDISYKVTPSLQIGGGRLLTTMGYESLLKAENTTYGTTIAYSTIVPGYGEGVRVRYKQDSFVATLSSYNQVNYGAYGEGHRNLCDKQVGGLHLVRRLPLWSR
ncbi:MAG: outer membrane beta-barrel protein [Bdellovibrio sp.]